MGWADSEVKLTYLYMMVKRVDLARAAGFGAVDIGLRVAGLIEAGEMSEALGGVMASSGWLAV